MGNKLEHDKYYTPTDLAQYCVLKTKDVVGEGNISEYIEPSGGNGAFLDYLPDNTYSCDILPEDNRVVKQDYLSLSLPYKKGRCIIGNPPFGVKGNLMTQFYLKAITECDYISFILPISQLNNDIKLYQFDLIYSEDLGDRLYSNMNVHCCLNIYKRPKVLNKRPNYKLEDVTIKEIRVNRNPKRAKLYDGFSYDYAICAWGGSRKRT